MVSYLEKLANRQSLTRKEAENAMETLMSGSALPAQIAALLAALRTKGESIEEITAFASVLRSRADRVDTGVKAIDIVGTGGDGANTFNISTAAAIVTAAAGMPVAKHGNRASSGRCGTADVLEALGANIHNTPKEAVACLLRTNFCFLFAQDYHLAMRHVAQVRKELGIRTIFNLIGPLANPAFVSYQLLGVANDDLVLPMAKVLAGLGLKNCLVVHGEDGPDEFTLGGTSLVAEVRKGVISEYRVEPEMFGIKRASLDKISGGDAKENAEIILSILKGEEGPRRDVVLMNAGAALYIADRASSITEGIKIAEETINSGKAKQCLDNITG